MLVLVVGPSGAGKDTLINAAKAALQDDRRFVFPRRVVTREAVAALEDHESVTAEEFALREQHGAYALSWEAHGLRYGLPASIAGDIAAKRVVVMNGSRRMIPLALERFPGTRVVLVEATPEVRAARLGGRGRESAEEIEARLRREVDTPMAGAIRVDNSGTREAGEARFIAVLTEFAAF
ncbi:MAG: phosphonate metabolism protein/1,5-bisphosphokinase (PRPP-forming) PhnN [Hyphomicrobiales bacterium]|nr:MAG: phosphonate metabolism protein/1,5-bisphosphokinase (PRPP-forming) PhnN [Hyphomicrobiales bacterium]